jgi:hypothetical protein
MRKYLSIGLMFITSINVAQEKPMFPNVQALKIAFVTKELNLSVEEAQIFWPVYNTYTSELYKNKQAMKDNTDILAYQEKVLNIRKKYKIDFKRVLGTDERANKVFLADENFGKLVKKELQNRQKMKERQLAPPISSPK